jgi:DNA-binding CsgD family transcriptional regulator
MSYKKVSVYYISEKDRQILNYLAAGLLYREISELMFIAPTTLQQYIWHMKYELEAKTMAQLISIAYQKRYIVLKPYVPEPLEVVSKKAKNRYIKNTDNL